jgi:IS30 family transposase
VIGWRWLLRRRCDVVGGGLIRRYVGKGTNLSVYTPADLRAIETRINTIPRRSIHWHTAQDLYTAAVAMTG